MPTTCNNQYLSPKEREEDKVYIVNQGKGFSVFCRKKDYPEVTYKSDSVVLKDEGTEIFFVRKFGAYGPADYGNIVKNTGVHSLVDSLEIAYKLALDKAKSLYRFELVDPINGDHSELEKIAQTPASKPKTTKKLKICRKDSIKQ